MRPENFVKVGCQLDKQILIAIITASITAIVSVTVVVIGKYYDKRREIEQQQRSQKITFYSEFLKSWFSLLDKYTEGVSVDDTSLIKEMKAFTLNASWNLILWAGNDVVQEYLNFRKFICLPKEQLDKIDGSVMLLQFENIIFEIRKELGHRNIGNNKLDQLDFISLYTNDVDISLRPRLDSINKELRKIVS